MSAKIIYIFNQMENVTLENHLQNYTDIATHSNHLFLE